MENLTVNVLKRHIEAGNPGDCTFCPIALAILEMPGVKGVSAKEQFIAVDYKDGRFVWYVTPDNAAEFMQTFDAAGTAEPETFVLIPESEE